ncbi:MAG: polyprenyl synthetase family protein [Alistipes sp.]|jgi:octaprenyl-diphosphate synthase|nr:polyprenyl synthetase family protein [Alistipes sp.]MBQ5899459.1 polyprenyl synthetase family protein [Alistipes sp.]
MITLDAIRTPIAADLEAFEEFIRSRFSSEGKLLSEMISHVLSSRGKGIRPIITMLCSALVSDVNNREWVEGERNCSKRTYLGAMMVEMLHTASLIHDDVIDNADTRRGRPSANALWQSRNAVVLGDYILARTMSIGMDSAQYDLVSHIVGSVATLCEGEILQSQHAADKDTTRQDYFEIIYKKTASLISISASAGAVSVKAPRQDVEQMRRFGEALGMAFQIQDDILDYSRSAQTGKPTNNDLREGKITLPLIEVLEKCSPAEKLQLLDKLSQCKEDEAAVDFLQGVVEATGGTAMAARTMQTYIDRATSILAKYPDSPYRTALVNLCAFVAERDK